jgi:hypothetical protein
MAAIGILAGTSYGRSYVHGGRLLRAVPRVRDAQYRSRVLGNGVLSNVVLLGAVTVSVALQLALHHAEWSRSLFAVTELSVGDVGLALACGLVPVSVLELTKLVRRLTRSDGYTSPNHGA